MLSMWLALFLNSRTHSVPTLKDGLLVLLVVCLFATSWLLALTVGRFTLVVPLVLDVDVVMCVARKALMQLP